MSERGRERGKDDQIFSSGIFMSESHNKAKSPFLQVFAILHGLAKQSELFFT
jgi:hypothetical protein